MATQDTNLNISDDISDIKRNTYNIRKRFCQRQNEVEVHICRLCGQVESNPYFIFDSNDNLDAKIKKCLNLEIYRDDFKPKQVCKSCYNKLDEFFNFIDFCYATDMKFDSIYYSEPWDHNGDITLYVPDATLKQSVIVSNQQIHDSAQFHHQSNTDSDGTIGVFPNYPLDQSEHMLGFSINLHNSQSNDMRNCFSERNIFVKQGNISAVEKSTYEQNKKTINSCLVNENDPSDLLDSVENEPSYGDNGTSSCGVIKNVLVSIDNVRESLMTNDSRENRHLDSVEDEPTSSGNGVNPGGTIQNVSVPVDDLRKSLQSSSLQETGHTSNLKTKKSFSCPHCEKMFLRQSNLNAHISVHTKIRPFECSHCSKTFAIKCHLTQHKKTHLDIFACQVCYKKFDVPSKLARHVVTHSNNKPFICNFPNCKRQFSDNSNLKQHSLLHSSESNFSCVICMKQFKTRKNLKAHIARHVSNHTFHCKYCQKVFKYKHNWKSHISRHTNKMDTE